jgi:hypothetical protein
MVRDYQTPPPWQPVLLPSGAAKTPADPAGSFVAPHPQIERRAALAPAASVQRRHFHRHRYASAETGIRHESSAFILS